MTTSVKGIIGVILTLNEAQSIVTAIRSLSWCDHVYVIDSGSTDTTVELSREHGATVLENRPAGRFLISEQRNWALDHIPHAVSWVLFLDADEEATPEFADAVMNQIGRNEKVNAYYAAPAFMYHGKWIKRTSGFPNWHPRLVRHGSGIRFSGGVWEDFSAEADAGHIDVPYVHRTNVKGFADWLTKHIRYADWESKQILEPLESRDHDSRRGIFRKIKYRLGPIRSAISILYLAFVRGGILDGSASLSYLRRMFIYELIIDEYLVEKRQIANGGEL